MRWGVCTEPRGLVDGTKQRRIRQVTQKLPVESRGQAVRLLKSPFSSSCEVNINTAFLSSSFQMRVTIKKCLGPMLLTGLTLLALFYAWSPGASSSVDVRPRQRSPLQKLLHETIQGIISVHHNDIAYHIKEDVAWCVITQHVCSFV